MHLSFMYLGRGSNIRWQRLNKEGKLFSSKDLAKKAVLDSSSRNRSAFFKAKTND